jgi:CRISPR-associated protein Cmr5
MKTRAQQDMELAERLVSEVAEKSGEVKRIYGGLCHSFPVMTRTCGLCQALAFSMDKSTAKDGTNSARAQAHRLILEHVARLLGVQAAYEAARDADAGEYIRYTRRALAAWIYFKRFAVSILKVENAQEGQDD